MPDHEAAGTPPRLPTDSRDVAWIAVPARQSPRGLAAELRDIEVLFRLNPYYIFTHWRRIGPSSHHAGFDNDSNQQKVDVEFDVASGPGDGLTLTYRQGIKKKTFFTIEPFGRGSRLIVTDDYEGSPAAEREARLAEVDKSLAAWGEALRVYFARLRRWSWLPGWRWYIRRVWIPMKPSQRRVVWLIWLITVAEFFFFLFVLLIWTIERNH
jgi:hypothetical protein